MRSPLAFRRRLRYGAPMLILTLTAALQAPACSAAGRAASPSDPGGSEVGDPSLSGPWLQYADPAEVGYDAGTLAAACEHADSVGSAALMAVHRGRVLVACGAVDRELELHSIRKSLVSGLFGTAVARGEVALDATLEELAIDDDTPLTAAERRATLADVLAARSGVYLPAAYAPSSQDRERPTRGSHDPGTHWFYSNWDFNVAGVIYERATGEDLYESFLTRIAAPLGMQDYDPGDGFLAFEPTLSRHPAHTFRMSARDLARFGQLYLDHGRWDGEQLIPADWIERSTAPISDFGGGEGYGFMWWTYDGDALDPDRYPALAGRRIYMGRGSGSHALWVVPSLELVIVHRADTDHGRAIQGADAWAMAERVVAAGRAGERAGSPGAGSSRARGADERGPAPRLVALDPTPLASQLPEYRPPDGLAMDPHTIEPLLGEYPIAPGAVIRIFRFRGDPYIHVPGEGDARLFQVGRDTFTIRVVPGVRVEFLRDGNGAARAVQLTLGERVVRAERADGGARGEGPE